MQLTRGFLALLALVLASLPAQAASLVELYQRASMTHPALQAQLAAVERAGARVDQASSRLKPQISATLGFAHNDFRGEGSPRDEYASRRHVLQIRQALFDLPSFNQLQAEESRVAQNGADLEATRTELASDLVERYLDVLNASEDLRSLLGEREAVVGQLARLKSMHQRQMAKVTDLLEAQAYLATLDAKGIEARNAKISALERLRELVGDPVEDVAGLSSGSLPALAGDMDNWVRQGLADNRRYAALSHGVAAEQGAIASTRAQHAPQVGLTLSKTWSDADSDSRRNPPFNVASIGLQITIPIYEGGRVAAATRESLARRDVAVQQREEKRREIEREIRTAFLKTQSDLARIEAMAQTVTANEKARDAQLKGLELGAATVVDFLDSQRRLFRARADHAKARHDFVRSQTALRRQAGALGERELQEISAWMTGAMEPTAVAR